MNLNSSLKSVPGFRSGSKIKSTIASVVYFIAGTLLLGSLSGPSSTELDSTQQNIVPVNSELDYETVEPSPTFRPTDSPTSTPRPTSRPVKTLPVVNTETSVSVTQNSQYSCSPAKTCGQMSSCEEAYYYLNVCGHSKRDGDGDGVPCESICPGG